MHTAPLEREQPKKKPAIVTKVERKGAAHRFGGETPYEESFRGLTERNVKALNSMRMDPEGLRLMDSAGRLIISAKAMQEIFAKMRAATPEQKKSEEMKSFIDRRLGAANAVADFPRERKLKPKPA
ncbi:hypothetical protein HZC09_04080 [Candidatus Micrarchaeota archaeon]|nr:hypothetical protein [Candidatus Micrarchaeota archaeon]